ncbi:MAG: SUF system Fe-S cluster assembly regulator [Methylohalobius sp.]|nr:SUF system Fe-S cluster assembly regulator [Methylohalobius sp.]
MLLLSKLADYAIIIASYSAREPQQTYTAAEIALAVNIALPTVQKILKRLNQAGLLQSERGPHGGYRLAKRPDEISVAQIIAALDGPIGLTECSLAEDHCQKAKGCNIRSNLSLINQALKIALEAVTLADMIKPTPREVSISLDSLRAHVR